MWRRLWRHPGNGRFKGKIQRGGDDLVRSSEEGLGPGGKVLVAKKISGNT